MIVPHKGPHFLEGNKAFQAQSRLWASWRVAQGKCLVEGRVDVRGAGPGRNRTKGVLPSVCARGAPTKPSIEERDGQQLVSYVRNLVHLVIWFSVSSFTASCWKGWTQLTALPAVCTEGQSALCLGSRLQPLSYQHHQASFPSENLYDLKKIIIRKSTLPNRDGLSPSPQSLR